MAKTPLSSEASLNYNKIRKEADPSLLQHKPLTDEFKSPETTLNRNAKRFQKDFFSESLSHHKSSSSISLIQDSPRNPFKSPGLLERSIRNPKYKKPSIQNYDEQTPSLFSQMIIDGSIDTFSDHLEDLGDSEAPSSKNSLLSKSNSQSNPEASKLLKGMDVSLNDADREFILYKESKEIYSQLQEQLQTLENDIKKLSVQLKSQEDEYKYKLEESGLMNEDFISFRNKLLELPLDLFPEGLATKLHSISLRPEEILAYEDVFAEIVDKQILRLNQVNSDSNSKPRSSQSTVSFPDSNKDSKPVAFPSQDSVNLKKADSIKSFKQSLGSAFTNKTKVRKSPVTSTKASKRHVSNVKFHPETNLGHELETEHIFPQTVGTSSFPQFSQEITFNPTKTDPIINPSSELPPELGESLTRIQLFLQRQTLLKSSRSRLARLLGL